MRMRKYQGGGSTPQDDPETIQKIIDAAKSGGVDLIKTLFKANMLPLNVVDMVLESMRGEGEENEESTMRGTDMVRDMIASGELPEQLPEQGPVAERVAPRPERAPDPMDPIGMSEVPNKLPRVIKMSPDARRQEAAEELMKMLRSQGY